MRDRFWRGRELFMYLGRKLSSIVVRSEAIFSCSDDVPDWESGDAQTADDSLSWDRNALLQDPKRKRGGHYVSHGGSLERPARGSLGLVHDLGIRTMRGSEVVSRARDSRDRSLCITPPRAGTRVTFCSCFETPGSFPTRRQFAVALSVLRSILSIQGC